jgi:branched-chain amino acid transport system permease protein
MLSALDYLVFFGCMALNFSILTLGLNLQWGFTGLFNVGIAGFMAVGAYATAILTGPPYAASLGGFGLPVLVGWLGAMLAAGLAAALVGLVTLRLRQDYLAIATFGIAVALQLVALNLEPLTGGAFGLASLPRPFGEHFTASSARNAAFLVVVALALLLAYTALELLVLSPWGRVLRAIREDEMAAQALGKSPWRYRLESFVIGSMLMGLGGGIYASFIGFVAPNDFLPILTFQVWTMLIVGGAGNNRGAVLGGVVVWALWTATGSAMDAVLPSGWQVRGSALQIVLIGTSLCAILLVRPGGLLTEAGAYRRQKRRAGDGEERQT